MGRLKTIALGLVLMLSTAQAHAQDGLLHTVATCVGRLSAQMEHHWLFEDKSSDIVETQRAHMIDILQALTTSDNARFVLSHRIDAKHAHASLLTRASFSTDPKVVKWAHTQSERQIAACNSLTLASAPMIQTKRSPALDASSAAKTMNQSAVNVSR